MQRQKERENEQTPSGKQLVNTDEVNALIEKLKAKKKDDERKTRGRVVRYLCPLSRAVLRFNKCSHCKDRIAVFEDGSEENPRDGRR